MQVDASNRMFEIKLQIRNDPNETNPFMLSTLFTILISNTGCDLIFTLFKQEHIHVG